MDRWTGRPAPRADPLLLSADLGQGPASKSSSRRPRTSRAPPQDPSRALPGPLRHPGSNAVAGNPATRAANRVPRRRASGGPPCPPRPPAGRRRASAHPPARTATTTRHRRAANAANTNGAPPGPRGPLPWPGGEIVRVFVVLPVVCCSW
jgi:hypothetical protein